ncbi:MAG: hypothetical protein EA402_11295 [Planctomycetota bacterium]|nr:MAG: hypothetical protein EA402_11295 [Planctomycetota bacterium]
MPICRQALCGPPHCYYLSVRTALDLPRLAESGVAALLGEQLELVREVFDAHLYAWRIQAEGFQLVLRHRVRRNEDSSLIAQRWQRLGGKSTPRPESLQARLVTLSGLMQTLLSSLAKRLRRHTGGPGTWWAPRFTSCLLCDDSALIAAITALEYTENAQGCLGSSQHQHGQSAIPGQPHLAPPPLSVMPDGTVLPRDTTPMGIRPPPPGLEQELLDTCVSQMEDEQLMRYRQAIERSWAMGRPESLSECLARLGRSGGRGRSRRARELDDEWGLCGAWG